MLAFLGECAPVSPFLPNDFVRNLRDADVDVEKVRKIGFLSARERTIERGNKRLKGCGAPGAQRRPTCTPSQPSVASSKTINEGSVVKKKHGTDCPPFQASAESKRKGGGAKYTQNKVAPPPKEGEFQETATFFPIRRRPCSSSPCNKMSPLPSPSPSFLLSQSPLLRGIPYL